MVRKDRIMLKFFYIVLILITVLIDAALLELGKHTLIGFVCSLCFIAFYLFLRNTILDDKSFLFRLAGYAGLLLCLAFSLKISGPPVRPIPAVTVKDPETTGVIRVAQGELTGVYNMEKTVEVYAGIPYAKPPVGDLRWREPQDPDNWEGVRRCDTFAPMSMQARTNPIFASLTDIFVSHIFSLSLEDHFLEPISEDSLYLNIWKPAGEMRNAPVLLFIHGGSLTTGQPSYSEYNGETLAKKGVIVVNFGYRLNVFGYFASEDLAEESPNGTTGNYGLLDQIKALQWVHDNISAFGGDPDNITIAGESAGASSVNALCVSPLTEGLFRRAVAESSGITARKPYHTFRTMEKALETGRKILNEFSAESAQDLRNIEAEKLVNTAFANSAMTVDGYAITQEPWKTYEQGNNHEEALLNGFNVHEADLFNLFTEVTSENYIDALRPVLGEEAEAAAALFPPSPVEKEYHYIVERGGNAKGSFNRIYSAAWFSYSHFDWSRFLEKEGRPVYMYHFTKDNGGFGSNHAGEMPYLYGNLFRHQKLYDNVDDMISAYMVSYLVNFARNGDPNGEGLPEWDLFSADGKNVMEFGLNIGMITDPNSMLYPLIDRFQGYGTM